MACGPLLSTWNSFFHNELNDAGFSFQNMDSILQQVGLALAFSTSPEFPSFATTQSTAGFSFGHLNSPCHRMTSGPPPFVHHPHSFHQSLKGCVELTIVLWIVLLASAHNLDCTADLTITLWIVLLASPLRSGMPCCLTDITG